ncbi:MAG: hypothetical protein M3O30_16155 [Planctomycetota bacterium]|nr:hypothetical protein [Planctomycetota bacterium]
MSQKSKVVTFSLTCPQPRAWLVLKTANRKPRVVVMRQRLPDLWSASEELMPGEYHCCYYCGDDLNVNYYGPARVDGGVDCGMDTLVSIHVA